MLRVNLVNIGTLEVATVIHTFVKTIFLSSRYFLRKLEKFVCTFTIFSLYYCIREDVRPTLDRMKLIDGEGDFWCTGKLRSFSNSRGFGGYSKLC